MKSVIKILTVILAIGAVCQAVFSYAGGKKSESGPKMTKSSPGP